MRLYLRMMLAGLMALPAADGLRHGDIWLCGSFAAGAAFVLAANRLLGETVEVAAFNKSGSGSSDAPHAGPIAIGRNLKLWLASTIELFCTRAAISNAASSRRPIGWPPEIF